MNEKNDRHEAAQEPGQGPEPSPKYAHQPCDDCDPSFINCWTAREPCRKKPIGWWELEEKRRIAAQPPQREAKPGDWMERCTEELLTTMVTGNDAKEMARNLRASTRNIIAKHAQNAAGDARADWMRELAVHFTHSKYTGALRDEVIEGNLGVIQEIFSKHAPKLSAPNEITLDNVKEYLVNRASGRSRDARHCNDMLLDLEAVEKDMQKERATREAK